LVGVVVVGAGPGLDRIAVGGPAVCEVEALVGARKFDEVARHRPFLGGEAGVTGPNLHPDTVRRVRTSVEAEVCASELNSAVYDGPLLGTGVSTRRQFRLTLCHCRCKPGRVYRWPERCLERRGRDCGGSWGGW
jgi:hypothetical protein